MAYTLCGAGSADSSGSLPCCACAVRASCQRGARDQQHEAQAGADAGRALILARAQPQHQKQTAEHQEDDVEKKTIILWV